MRPLVAIDRTTLNICNIYIDIDTGEYPHSVEEKVAQEVLGENNFRRYYIKDESLSDYIILSK